MPIITDLNQLAWAPECGCVIDVHKYTSQGRGLATTHETRDGEVGTAEADPMPTGVRLRGEVTAQCPTHAGGPVVALQTQNWTAPCGCKMEEYYDGVDLKESYYDCKVLNKCATHAGVADNDLNATIKQELAAEQPPAV